MLIVIISRKENCKNVNYSHFGSPIIDQYSTRSKKISTHFKKKKETGLSLVQLSTHSLLFAVSLLLHLRRCWYHERFFPSFRYVFHFLGKEFLKRNLSTASVSVQPLSKKGNSKSSLRDPWFLWVVIEPIKFNYVTVWLDSNYLSCDSH